MKKYKLLVMTFPVAGKEDEFNDWYTNTHLDQVVALPGFVSAQRFSLTQNMVEGSTSFPYCAIYDIETDNYEAAMGELVGQAGDGNMLMSDSLDVESANVWLFEEMGGLVKKIK